MSDNEQEEGITGQNIRNVVLNHAHCKHYFSIAEIPCEREKARIILGCCGVLQALLQTLLLFSDASCKILQLHRSLINDPFHAAEKC